MKKGVKKPVKKPVSRDATKVDEKIVHGPIGLALMAAIEQNRKANGETDSALSVRSGVSASQISRFMKKERDIQLCVVDRLASALGLKLVRADNSKR